MSAEQSVTAIVKRPPQTLEPWHAPAWQRLWLALQARPWNALALVPASVGAPPDFTLRIASTLARTGMVHLSAPVQVADGTRVQLSSMVSFQNEVRACQQAGDRVLLALSPIAENPVTDTLAQGADCSLLCLLFEAMAASDAKRTVTAIGKERFIGSAIFRPDPSGGLAAI
jgi:hypothetical protein